MLELIRRVSEWGVRPDTPIDRVHRFRLTNVLLLFMFFASIGETALCFGSGAYEAGLLNSTAPLVFGTGLWLMKSGYTTVARLFVVILSSFGAYALVASLGPESYFQFILLFASAFAIATFSFEEKALMCVGVFLPLLCFVILEVTHYAPILGMSRPDFTTNQITLMHIVSVSLVWTLMMMHFVFFMRDRRRSQAQLILSAKMVAMARMASGLAHEVNNPLQLIVSYAERIMKQSGAATGAQAQVTESAQQIQSVAMRIASINKGLLALSRDTTHDPFLDVSARAMVKVALDFCRAHLEARQIQLHLDEIPAEWCISGRETQLSEVILNVLNNAYDAVSDQVEKWIRIEVKADREWIEFVISDSGEGVSEKVAGRIFDPFFTTKPPGKGTGLGLSISQSIVVAHGGQIYCDRGSSFTKFVVRLPRCEDLQAKVKATHVNQRSV